MDGLVDYGMPKHNIYYFALHIQKYNKWNLPFLYGNISQGILAYFQLIK